MEIYISKPERCQPCCLKMKKEGSGSAINLQALSVLPFKVIFDTSSGPAFFFKIVSALTNRGTIDENNETTRRGDECEEL